MYHMPQREHASARSPSSAVHGVSSLALSGPSGRYAATGMGSTSSGSSSSWMHLYISPQSISTTVSTSSNAGTSAVSTLDRCSTRYSSRSCWSSNRFRATPGASAGRRRTCSTRTRKSGTAPAATPAGAGEPGSASRRPARGAAG
jgi:hypothetical protein